MLWFCIKLDRFTVIFIWCFFPFIASTCSWLIAYISLEKDQLYINRVKKAFSLGNFDNIVFQTVLNRISISSLLEVCERALIVICCRFENSSGKAQHFQRRKKSKYILGLEFQWIGWKVDVQKVLHKFEVETTKLLAVLYYFSEMSK